MDILQRVANRCCYRIGTRLIDALKRVERRVGQGGMGSGNSAKLYNAFFIGDRRHRINYGARSTNGPNLCVLKTCMQHYATLCNIHGKRERRPACGKAGFLITERMEQNGFGGHIDLANTDPIAALPQVRAHQGLWGHHKNPVAIRA
jgi:hypothetical protein